MNSLSTKCRQTCTRSRPMHTEQALVPVRRTARQREERRIRIMGMVRSGFSYEEIARDERLSRERIRQIVTQSLKTDDGANRVDQARVRMARLEPALRLAARKKFGNRLFGFGGL